MIIQSVVDRTRTPTTAPRKPRQGRAYRASRPGHPQRDPLNDHTPVVFGPDRQTRPSIRPPRPKSTPLPAASPPLAARPEHWAAGASSRFPTRRAVSRQPWGPAEGLHVLARAERARAGSAHRCFQLLTYRPSRVCFTCRWVSRQASRPRNASWMSSRRSQRMRRR